MVYNTRPGLHAAFNRSREHFGARHSVFTFRENHRAFPRAAAAAAAAAASHIDASQNPAGLTSAEVRRQTVDYVSMLRECAWGGASAAHPESFLMIVEVGW